MTKTAFSSGGIVQNINPATVAAQTQHYSKTTAEDIKKQVGEYLSEIESTEENSLDVDRLDRTLTLLKNSHEVLVDGLDKVDGITN